MAAKELKLKRMATMANDFAFGHEQCAGFQRVFEEAGGKIVRKLWPPLNVSDYLPYLSQLTRHRRLVQRIRRLRSRCESSAPLLTSGSTRA